jgi:hypothetical protein
MSWRATLAHDLGHPPDVQPNVVTADEIGS